MAHGPVAVSRANFSKWSALPLTWNGLPIPAGPPDMTHCCRGVSVVSSPIRLSRTVDRAEAMG